MVLDGLFIHRPGPRVVLKMRLAESACRLEAVQQRRQVAWGRGGRRYVDGRDRRGRGGVALLTMFMRKLVPRHSRGSSGSNPNSRIQ